MTETETIKRKKEMSWTSFFTLLIVIIFFRIFILEPHNVSGSSMDNTFKNGDYVLVDKISYRFKNPSKGDIVVFDPPAKLENKSRFIKRIISKPGETIEVSESNTYINNEIVNENFVVYKSPKTSSSTILKENEYFVMGDNRFVSYDSRYWGPITNEEIQGRVLLRLYPFNKIEFFPGIKEYKNNN